MEIEERKLLAEACGIHAGDGYVRSDDGGRNELDISGSLEEKEYYENHVKNIFSKILDSNIKCKHFEKRNTYGFRVYGKEVSELFIDKLGFPNGKKEKIKIPQFILSGDTSLKTLFLRGLYDTDGYIGFYKRHGNYSEWKKNHHYYPRITFTNSDRKLVGQVEDLLEEIGIGYFTRVNERSDGTRFNVTSTGKDNLKAFMQSVGFQNPVKKTKYKVWKKFGYCPTKTTIEERYKILAGELDPEQYYK